MDQNKEVCIVLCRELATDFSRNFSVFDGVEQTIQLGVNLSVTHRPQWTEEQYMLVHGPRPPYSLYAGSGTQTTSYIDYRTRSKSSHKDCFSTNSNLCQQRCDMTLFLGSTAGGLFAGFACPIANSLSSLHK